MSDSRMNEENNVNINGNMMDDGALEQEEVPPNFHTDIPESQKADLIQEAQDMKPLLENFDQEFNSPANEYFYVVSAKWLRSWKRYTSYNQIKEGNNPDERWFGQITPEKINQDIVEKSAKAVKYPDEDDYRNVFLRDQIQEKKDYELVTEAAWKYLANKYDNVPVKRFAYTRHNGMKYVEVALKQINLVPVNNNFLKDVDHKRVHDFRLHLVQASGQSTLGDLRSDLAKIAKLKANKSWYEASTSYMSSFEVSEENLRLWKLDPALSLKAFYQKVKEICENYRTYDYQIEFKGQFLDKESKETKLEEAQIAAEDYIFLEARESHKGWNFYGDGAPMLAKCEFCNKYGELAVQCACKKVAYCSDDCKMSDKRFHRSRCDKAGEDEEEESKTLVEKPDSKHGLVGLQNLGNTCFMNSGLQCLSNVVELTRYFLLDRYIPEINETNPLGTKGKLVKKYATFLKNLWFGTGSVYSPWALKQGISEFQPMFSGYQQHDSQELLAFLLDGLHEDLNRVKVKPFTEVIESEGQDDYAAGLKSWENHLKRNQSIIVDLLHGQFKSKITCPTCGKISITFDPFNTVSLPLTVKKDKEIDFFFIHADNRQKSVKLAFTYPKTTHTVAQLKQQTAAILGKNPNNFYFVFSTYHSKDVVTDEEKMLTNELRKKKKYKTLFALEVAQEDLNADPDDRYDVDIHTTKKASTYYGSQIHKPISFVRIISLRKSYTLKQVYVKIFHYYRFLFDLNWPEAQKEEWLKLTDEEAFNKVWEQPENKPFTVHIIKHYTSSYTCYFCEQKRCDNCILPYNQDQRLSDLLAKIQDKDYKFELEIVFDTIPEFVNLENLNSFDDLSKKTAGGEDGAKGLSIKDCFNQFELPEQLGEDNAWYCSNCKAHQRATKKMEIYKAPPILLLHFKRFKSGNSFYKKGKITEKVDFPIEDFDVSEYVINHELPMEYPVDRQAMAPAPIVGEQTNQNTTADTENVSNVVTDKMNVEEDKEPNKKKVYTEGTVKVKSKLLYDLFAVVNHYGNLGFGHYTAYAKNHKDNSWHHFDDSRVSEEKEEGICTPAAYVLFYKRKDWEFQM